MRLENSRTKWFGVELGLYAVWFLTGFCITRIQNGEWWHGLSSFNKRLAEGIGLAGFGVVLMCVKWRAGRLKPTNPWEFKMLLFDVAIVIGGTACLVQAVWLL